MSEACSPFKPVGNTFTLTAASPAPTPAQLGGSPGGLVSVLCYNASSSVDAWLGFAPLAATASSNAVIPTGGSPTAALPLPAGKLIAYTLPAQSFLTAITASNTAACYFAPGEGVMG